MENLFWLTTIIGLALLWYSDVRKKSDVESFGEICGTRYHSYSWRIFFWCGLALAISGVSGLLWFTQNTVNQAS